MELAPFPIRSVLTLWTIREKVAQKAHLTSEGPSGRPHFPPPTMLPSGNYTCGVPCKWHVIVTITLDRSRVLKHTSMSSCDRDGQRGQYAAREQQQTKGDNILCGSLLRTLYRRELCRSLESGRCGSSTQRRWPFSRPSRYRTAEWSSPLRSTCPAVAAPPRLLSSLGELRE